MIKYGKNTNDIFNTLPSRFYKIVHRFGGSYAIVQNNKSYSYNDIYNLARVIAFQLNKDGVKKGDYVSIELPSSAEYYIARFGIWMLGAVAICLSNKTNANRKKAIYKLCNSPFVINESYVKKAFNNNKRINKDKIVRNKPDDPSYVIFTSGSTGQPKGVLHTHKSAAWSIIRVADNCKLNSFERHACNASPEFIASSVCDFAPLFYGGSLFIVPESCKRDLSKLIDFIRSSKIKSLFIMPDLANYLIEAKLPLDYLFVVGSVARNVFSKDFKIFNGYGSTETGGTFFDIDKKYTNTPIGKGSKFGKLYLLDKNMKKAKSGELYFAGPIFKEYISDLKATNEVKVKNPFRNNDGFEYLYKTGDLAKINADGNLIYAGRKDFMAKINGQRVEPSEVENVLYKHESINEVAVKAFSNKFGTYLCAYYVSKRNVSEDSLKNLILKYLPSYMLPSYFLKVNKISKNKNGKIDYKSLKAPSIKLQSKKITETLSHEEKTVANQFKELLGVKFVGVEDDFVKLGGSSLQAMKLASNLSDYDLSSADVLKLRTVSQIACYLEKSRLDRRNLINYNYKSGRPLTGLALNMLLDIQLNNKNNAYTLNGSMDLGSSYSLNKVMKAIDKLAKTHPELLARLTYKNNEPWIVYDAKLNVEAVNGRRLEIDDELNKLNFDLEKSMSKFVVEKASKHIYLHYAFSHIIFDLESFAVLKSSLLKILKGASVEKDDGSLLYTSQLVQKQNTYNKSKKYFNEVFEDLETCNKMIQDFDGENGKYNLRFTLNKKALLNLLKESGVSEGSLFTSIFAYTLSRFTGSENVQFCTTTSDRNWDFAKNSIGLFVQTFPLLYNCENTNVINYLQNSSQTYYEAQKHGYYPLNKLVKDFSIDAQTVFQFIPNANEYKQGNYYRGDIKYDKKIILDGKNVMNEFLMYVMKRDNDYLVDVSYSGKYSHEQVRSFVKTFANVAKGFLAVDELSKVNLLSDDDKHAYELSNKTDLSLKYKDIIEVFSANVKKFPDRPCVRYKDTSYTYREVDVISNYIAKSLRKRGLKAKDSVGFLVHRSCWYVICLISLLKAGMVYIPIDDELPASRIALMIEDSNCKAILHTKNCEEKFKKSTKIARLDNIASLLLDDKLAKNALKNNFKFKAALPDKYATSGIVYTSGSTGLPKGVCLNRIGAINLASWYNHTFRINEHDRYAYYPSIGFVVHLNMFYALYAGACVDIVPEEARYDMRKLNSYFTENNITHTFLTSRVADEFFTTQENHTLKFVQKGGERLEEFDYDGDTFIFEGYGASETNAASVFCPKKDKNISSCIGKPVSNTKFWILDKEGRSVPVFGVGELCISGNQLSNCYLNDEALSSRNFKENPFMKNSKKYSRMYLTGDYAYIQEDGKIVNVGRKDSTVKVRGNRVNLAEVESEIKKINFVSNVAVRTFINNGNCELVAYVVHKDKIKKNQQDHFADEVRDFVSKKKPSFMVPAFVIFIDDIPLNLNGKINAKKLPKPKVQKSKLNYKKPETKIEKQICLAFEKVLSVKNVGLNEGFVSLGGDSFTAIKLLSVLKDYDISIADVLTLQSPKLIAAKVSESTTKLREAKASALKRGIKLNEQQLNVYLDIEANKNNKAYNIPFKFRFPGQNSIKLKNTLKKMLDCHPVLKACIAKKNGNPELIITDNFDVKTKKSVTSKDIKDFYNAEFELSSSLSRFLIDEKSASIYCVFHHLVFDGMSIKVFQDDFEKLLDGKKVGLDLGFATSSYFSSDIKQSGEYKKAEEFYNAKFANLSECDDLIDDVGAIKPSYCSKSLSINSKNIQSLINELGITKNILFTSAFAYTLSRFNNSDFSYFTLTENGRDRINAHDSIGMFANTLPILVDCNNYTIKEFLLRAKDNILTTFKYNYYPFRLLAKKFGVNNNINFQYRQNLNNSYKGKKKNFMFEEDLFKNAETMNDLSFTIEDRGNDVVASITTNSKFLPSTAKRILNTFEVILKQMCNVKRLNEINYSLESDVVQFNKINNTNQRISCSDILEVFNKSVKNYPNNTFVKFKGLNITYKNSLPIINSISAKLKKYESKSIVAVLVDRSHWYALSALAVLNSGHAYLPIDESLPDNRIKFMLKDSGACAVLTTNVTEKRAKKLFDKDVINVSKLKGSQTKLLNTKFNEEDGAIALYTSGSTGEPKCVLLPRRAILSFCDWCSKKTAIKAEDCFSMYCSFGFDVHAEALFTPIFVGASIDIVPTETRTNLEGLVKHFEEQKVTHVELSTAFTKLLLNYKLPSSFKVLLTGGETWGDIKPDTNVTLYDTYGPTEAMVSVSYVKISDKIHHSSIGSLTSNTKAYVLDKQLRRVPFGAVGELYLSGKQVAKGYLNRQQDTEEAYIKNPFDKSKDHSVIYKTGDVVRFLPDNTLGYIGRSDNQFKIRGNRVELGEVEASIRDIKSVKDVTVQLVENEGSKIIVAYVVSSDKKVEEAIKAYFSKNKPEYMMPSHIVLINKIPLNVNNKVDVSALPKIDLSKQRRKFTSPTNDAEKDICKAFAKVLKIGKVGIEDDFIEHGGDSLIAIEMISLLDKYEISASDVLKLKTPKLIAEQISPIKKFENEYGKYNSSSNIPLSEQQLNVYLDIKLHNKIDSYIIPLIVDLDKFSLSNIERNLNKIFDAHPILRFRIKEIDGNPYLKIGNKPNIEYKRNLSDKFIEDFFANPFDLNNNLCRFVIDKQSKKLYCAFHHIIFDGLSTSVFADSVESILDGNKVSKDLGFIKSSEFSEIIKTKNIYKEAEEYFDKKFCDTEDIQEVLPDDKNTSASYISHKLHVKEDLIQDFVKKYGITKNVLFTSAFAYTVSRFTHSDVAYFTMIENGRDRIKAYDSVGMFVNTLPIMFDCKDKPINEFIETCKDNIFQSLKFNFYPFRLINNKYHLNNNVSFQYEAGDESVNNDLLNRMLSNRKDFINDLAVVVSENKGSYSISITCSKKYSRQTAKRIQLVFEKVVCDLLIKNKLSAIVYSLDDDLSSIKSINKTSKKLKYEDVLQAFNYSLAKYPNNALVSYGDFSYTYRESAKWINNLKSRLASVKNSSRIALFVDRSQYYFLGALGVLNVGCPYVPIDDKYPDNRVKFMIEDSEASAVLVTDETINRAKKLTKLPLINLSKIGFEGKATKLKDNWSPDSTAVVLYTSGTTGKAKGTFIPRKALNNLSYQCIDLCKLNSNSTTGYYPSYVFDAHFESSYPALYVGGSVDIIPENIRLDIDGLIRYIKDRGINVVFFPTQIGKIIIDKDLPTCLKLIYIGGEKLGDVQNNNSCKIVDAYGPTEASAYTYSLDISKKQYTNSIGKLNINTKSYILDKERRQVPFGAVGELYLSGCQVANGYLNNVELTKSAFVDNPFDGKTVGYEKMYKTGDLVRYLPDKTVDFVGRVDSQVKIRGNRVELAEVELAVRSVKGVIDATVQVIQNESNKELVGYVVSNSDNVDESISKFFKDNKPDYMLPSHIVKLDKIPLNVNGKVDKRALPSVEVDSLVSNYQEATTKSEKIVCDCFKKILKVKTVSVTDSFLSLGGDSINAIRLSALLADNNISIEAGKILKLKTPQAIAKQSEDYEEVDFKTIEGQVPLAPIQKHYFSTNMPDNFSQYYVVKAKNDISCTNLQNAINLLTQKQDILRANFKNAKQIILPETSQVVKVKEIMSRAQNIDDLIRKELIESCKLISLRKNKLIDVKLINNKYVIFVIHHLIIDGVSWTTLLDNLSTLLNGSEVKRAYPYTDYWKNVNNDSKKIKSKDLEEFDILLKKVDEKDIYGKAKPYSKTIKLDFNKFNSYGISEQDFLCAVISRAYKKVYGKDPYIEVESTGRDDAFGVSGQTIGWYTTLCPVELNIGTSDNSINLAEDLMLSKAQLQNNNKQGIKYLASCYPTNKLKYKHMPLTVNYLSEEFLYDNDSFKSYNKHSIVDNLPKTNAGDDGVYGLDFNIVKNKSGFTISGNIPQNTYLAEKSNDLFKAISDEATLLAKMIKNKTLAYPLSDEQIRFYLDQKINQKDVAYSCFGYVKLDKSISDKEAINTVYKFINLHPVLKTKVVEKNDKFYGVTSAKPTISTLRNIKEADFENKLIKPFDVNEQCSRFFVIKNKDATFIAYDLHHIISDATSQMIINRKITNLFNGEKTTSKDLGFITKANKEISAKTTSFKKDAKQYWEKELCDIDNLPDLIEDKANKKGGILTLPIKGVKSKIKKLADDLSITENNILTACFAYTLSRFVNSSEVFFTYTNNGRDVEGSEDSIGLFIKMLPLVVNTSDASVSEYLKSVSTKMFEGLKYSRYSFNESNLDSALNQDICFEYNGQLNDVSKITKRIKYMPDAKNKQHITKMLAVVNDYEDDYLFSVEHSNCYSKEFVASFAKAFSRIVNGVLENKNLRDINYTEEKDINLFDKVNRSEEVSIKHKDIIQVFSEHARNYPKNVCVKDDKYSFTYAQVDKITNELAKSIEKASTRRDATIAFVTDRSVWYLICLIASLKANVAYVPIDRDLPKNRIAYILKDANVDLVLNSEDCKSLINDISTKKSSHSFKSFVLNDKFISNALSAKKSKFVPKRSINETAGLVFTSGTTGKPKGVCINRYGILNLAAWYKNRFGLKRNDVYAYYSSIGFIVHLNMFYAVYAGASVYIVPEDCRHDFNLLNERLLENKVTHIFFTSRVAEEFFTKQNNNLIKVAQKGGEKVEEFKYNGPTYIFEGYGATETGAASMYCPKDEKRLSSEIGKPVSNLRAYVLDAEGRRVPRYAIGELYIAGRQVANGYLNDSKLSNSTFFDNTIEKSDKHSRMYKTGDFAYYLNDGSIVNVGRKDSVTKINGNRISLSEVEDCINQIKIVKTSNVQLVKHNEALRLVAYVVTNEDVRSIKEGDLFELVTKQVSNEKPSYMVPSQIIKIDKIPLNINGKVDKKKLPDPIEFINKKKIAHPSSITETVVANIVANVLKINVDKLDIHDNLSNYGLTSLTCIKMLSYFDEAGLDIDAKIMLKNPSISEWANYIDENNSYVSKVSNNLPKNIYPLTDIGYYAYDISKALGKIYNNNAVFNTTKLLRIKNIDEKIVKEAIYKALDNHPGFKVKLVTIDNEVYAELNPNWKPNITVKTLTKKPTLEFFKKSIAPFNLEEDHLFRAKIFKYKNDLYLFVDVHHMITDGISNEIFITDLVEFLNNRHVKNEKINSLEWAELNKNKLGTKENKEDVKYYEQLIKGIGYCDFTRKQNHLESVASQHQKGEDYDYHYTSMVIPRNSIEKYCKYHNTSMSTFLLSNVLWTYSKIYGEDAMLLSVDSGRKTSKVNNTCGCLLQFSPVVYRKNDKHTFKNALREINSNVSENYVHDIYYSQFNDLMYNTNIFFNYHVEFEDRYDLDKVKSKYDISEVEGAMKFNIPCPICFYVDKYDDDNIVLTLNYISELYTDKTINKFMKIFGDNLFSELERY